MAVTDTGTDLSYGELLTSTRATFDSGVTKTHDWRIQQLKALRRLLLENEEALVGAVQADLGRPEMEAWTAEIATTRSEIDLMIRKLGSWMRDEKVRPDLKMATMKTRIVREPLGVVLVIAPWNYPAQLLLLPMAAAIAAGNCVIGKPSELAPTVSAEIARLVPQYLDPEAVSIVEGGVPETTALLTERWDHIFYTGNGAVGRVVMRAAAEHLTPVTLELGGKSPAIVAADADVKKAARRIVFGKFFNAGQTCVAPDYVLVDKRVEAELLEALASEIRSSFGDDPATSKDLGRIINERHFDRLVGLLDGGGYDSAVTGGDHDRATRYIAPTVLAGVADDSPVMADEIFGPILPVLAVDDTDDAVARVNQRDKPLALYVFTSSKETERTVLGGTSAGGGCVNDTLMHLAIPQLPFGGVGQSGMGAYHGKAGFETFSHRRSIMERPNWLELPILQPPYKPWKLKIVKKLF